MVGGGGVIVVIDTRVRGKRVSATEANLQRTLRHDADLIVWPVCARSLTVTCENVR